MHDETRGRLVSGFPRPSLTSIIGRRSASLDRNSSAKSNKAATAKQKHLHMISYHASYYSKQILA